MKNPIRPTIKTEVVPIFFVIISVILSFYFYAHFPDRVATHWNTQGMIDGWSSRAFAAFFFPALNIAIYFLLFFLPILDPKKANYENFRSAYHAIKFVLVFFLTTIYFLVGLNGVGFSVPVALFVPAGVGFLFLIIGYYLAGIKQNWFLGIRTPWTLNSEVVWQKTHRFGSWIFMLSGLLLIIASLLSQWTWIFMTIILVMILSIFIYSYFIYRQEQKG